MEEIKKDLKKDIEEVEEVAPFTTRHWTIVLYPDTTSYDCAEILQNIKVFYTDYCYILHTKEVQEKKDHYHVNLHLKDARTREQVMKKISLPSSVRNRVEPILSVRQMDRYLTHVDYPNKIQYSIDDVEVSPHYRNKFRKMFDDQQSEEDIIIDIYNFLDRLPHNSIGEDLRLLVIYVNSNCYDTIYKRYRTEFNEYLKIIYSDNKSKTSTSYNIYYVNQIIFLYNTLFPPLFNNLNKYKQYIIHLT